MKLTAIFYGIATAGGTLRYQDIAPTREKADQFVDARIAAPFMADANDWIWQWSSSADYDAMPGIDKIQATLLAINSADDERNPPETGVMQEALNRVPNGKLYLIPASTQTSGHLSTGNAKFYKNQLQEVLQKAPRRTM
jgi:homoserine O-acetyltransferase